MADRGFLTLRDISDQRDIYLSESQAKNNVRSYEQAKAEAARRGVNVRLLDDLEYARIVGEDVPDPRARKIDADGIHTDVQGVRWMIAYRGDILDDRGDVDVRRYEALSEQARQLGAQLTIQNDDERPHPPAAA